jgi:hypothetical protein
MTPEAFRAHHQPRVEARAARPYVGIAARATTTAGFRAAVDRDVPAVFRWVADHGLRPDGAPFLRYLEVDETAVRDDGPPPATFASCVPLAAPPGGTDGRVLAGELPAGRWVVALHRGGYAGLAALHRIVLGWAAEEGLVVARAPAPGGTAFAGCAEHFRIGPFEEPDPWRWETDVAYLLED